ncbi:hypothetical protein [Nostoc sp. UHCC 0252]|uniref:hypothetical protein n=1 Tax=Nostoc sp. UHCC 0252 TaxID=3110241 RepID=UPI002B219398|nr:hypothetical protein [Nostoc sp. UHCC 0252]MEA5600043.1 hypothetical protein [Nostoc sp. UHCC 0252]
MSLWILDTDSLSLFQRGNLEIARRLNLHTTLGKIARLQHEQNRIDFLHPEEW